MQNDKQNDERPREFFMDMPEVKDIPGQEHVHVPPLGELADTTASSADEEGYGILDELEDDSSQMLRQQPPVNDKSDQ